MKDMKTVNFRDLLINASDLLSAVEDGETLLVLRHGKPVAEISPILRRPVGSPSWKRRGLRLTAKGAALSAAIIEERRREPVL